jgi:hypothetical protein
MSYLSNSVGNMRGLAESIANGGWQGLDTSNQTVLSRSSRLADPLQNALCRGSQSSTVPAEYPASDEDQGALDTRFHTYRRSNSDLTVGGPVDWRNYANQDECMSDDGGRNLGNIHYGFDEQAGWSAQVSDLTSSEHEIVPGVTIQTDASFEAQARANAYVRGAVDASLSSDGVKAQLMGEAGVSAEASVDGTFNPTVNISGLIAVGSESQGQADAFAGTQAKGVIDTSLGWDSAYLGAGGSAFAGANASIDGRQSLTMNGQEIAEVYGGVGAQAGIGAEATFDLGLKDGELHFDLGAGLALGVGLKLELGGSVNVGFLTDTVSDVWDAGTDFITNPLGTASDLVSDGWHFGSDLATDAWNVGTNLAEDTWNAGTEVVAGVANQGAELVTDAADTAVNVVESTAETVVDTGKKVINTVEKAMPWNW